MAQGSKTAAADRISSAGQNIPQITHGAGGILISDAHLGGNRQANRKKMKQRQKLAAKQAAEFQRAMNFRDREIARTGRDPYGPSTAAGAAQPAHPPQPAQPEPPLPQDYGNGAYDGQDGYDDEREYTEDEGHAYSQQSYDPAYSNGHLSTAGTAGSSSRKKTKKKKKSKPTAIDTHNGAHIPSQAATNALRHAHEGQHRGSIWNTSTQEERERIKEFWLGLHEEKRKSLVKIEKEAVLKKMKEQQKHACSCTVCGRKRTAIEEELEVLYDAYYDELEGLPRHHSPPMINPPVHVHRPTHGQVQELPDDEDGADDLGEEEDYSDEEGYEDDFSDEDPDVRRAAHDLFNFGNSLQVKGGILTVADDLLKNDGKKFIEMMEQLAERRMQREEEAQYAATAHPSYDGNYRHNHEAGPEDEEFDEEEEDYDSQEDDIDDEEEDDMDAMTEEQRMEEGRRMFQIFAARLFEQRVLQAYKEQVAQERQQKLIEELEDEKVNDAQREAKKARDAEKRKQKKQAQKAKQAEERARKDAEKAAEEKAAKDAELKKQEELRKKREEQRKKKEAERKAQEEEKQRKEAERLKRQQEERERQQEAERRAREQKAAEKKARDEARRKEREGREAKEREIRERKAQAEREKKEREAKARQERESQERARREAQQAAQQAVHGVKRVGAPTAVPIPPGLQKQPSNLPSPHVPVATPAIPKAPTPVRPRQSSQQGSKGSSPKTPQISAGPSKSVSPSVASQASSSVQPKQILQKPQNPMPSAAPSVPPTYSMPPPPPGVPIPQGQLGLSMQSPNGFPQGPTLPGMGQRPSVGQMHQYPLGNMTNHQFRGFPPPGMSGPPLGFGMPGMAPIGRGFPDAPPGLQQHPRLGAGNQAPDFGVPRPENMPQNMPQPTGVPHSRQQSGSFDPQVVAPQPQTISRPAPIQRPSSVKPHGVGDEKLGKEVDEMANHLGSASLIDDNDEPLIAPIDTRRVGQPPGLARGPSNHAFGTPPLFSQGAGQHPFANPGSAWGTPQMPFGQGTPGTSSWGSPTSMWGPDNGLSFGAAPMGPGRRQHLPNHKQNRLNLCEAIQLLTEAKQTDGSGFIEVAAIMRYLDANGIGISIDELRDLTETLGDDQDGGGYFEVSLPEGVPFSPQAGIKFERSNHGPGGANPPGHGWGAPGGVGEIGSPTIGASHPAAPGAGPFGRFGGIRAPGPQHGN